MDKVGWDKLAKKRADRGGESAANTANRSRVEWLEFVANGMRGWFEDLSFPLPSFEMRTGFPSVGRRSSNTAESWTDDDGTSYVIFVRPDKDDAIDIAGAIAFQLCHIAVGPRDSHGYLFRHLAISVGLRGTRTESKPGVLFQELIKPILNDAGPLPKSEVTPEEPQRKVAQTTRLIKVSCKECGYVARVSRKWLVSVGAPLCPDHGPMDIES